MVSGVLLTFSFPPTESTSLSPSNLGGTTTGRGRGFLFPVWGPTGICITTSGHSTLLVWDLYDILVSEGTEVWRYVSLKDTGERRVGGTESPVLVELTDPYPLSD